MHKTVAAATALVRDLLATPGLFSADVEAVVCPPFTALPAVAALLGDQSRLGLGAQNMHYADEGPYTGEISAPMLVELGVRYVIIGHSERRTYFAESDENVNRKVKAALAHGLVPIVAVGETGEEHQRGEAATRVRAQTKYAFAGVTAADAARCVVAYEPIWAIGTGQACHAEEAHAVMETIRESLPAGDEMRVLYGGSVNPANIAEFMRKTSIDGALVGGASLAAASFAELISRSRSVLQTK